MLTDRPQLRGTDVFRMFSVSDRGRPEYPNCSVGDTVYCTVLTARINTYWSLACCPRDRKSSHRWNVCCVPHAAPSSLCALYQVVLTRLSRKGYCYSNYRGRNEGPGKLSYSAKVTQLINGREIFLDTRACTSQLLRKLLTQDIHVPKSKASNCVKQVLPHCPEWKDPRDDRTSSWVLSVWRSSQTWVSCPVAGEGLGDWGVSFPERQMRFRVHGSSEREPPLLLLFRRSCQDVCFWMEPRCWLTGSQLPSSRSRNSWLHLVPFQLQPQTNMKLATWPLNLGPSDHLHSNESSRSLPLISLFWINYLIISNCCWRRWFLFWQMLVCNFSLGVK